MIFYSADLHINHENILKYCDRPFSSSNEMDEKIIENWNKKVTGKDITYILGDFAFYKTDAEFEYIKKIFNALQGKKILIVGNHDKKRTIKDLQWEFVVPYYKLQYDNKQQIIMSHYPIISWDGIGRGSIMLHGHEHNLKNSNNAYKMFDVGVDANNFTPISIYEILQLAKNKCIPDPGVKFSTLL